MVGSLPVILLRSISDKGGASEISDTPLLDIQVTVFDLFGFWG
jgi:hypothetical protein